MAWITAANVDTFGIGAKATALGGAFSAYADDPFAVHYNPAGLVQIERPMLSAGFNVIDPGLEVSRFHVDNPDPSVNGIASFEDKSDNLYVPHVGFAMRLSDRWATGVAFTCHTASIWSGVMIRQPIQLHTIVITPTSSAL